MNDPRDLEEILAVDGLEGVVVSEEVGSIDVKFLDAFNPCLGCEDSNRCMTEFLECFNRA